MQHGHPAALRREQPPGDHVDDAEVELNKTCESLCCWRDSFCKQDEHSVDEWRAPAIGVSAASRCCDCRKSAVVWPQSLATSSSTCSSLTQSRWLTSKQILQDSLGAIGVLGNGAPSDSLPDGRSDGRLFSLGHRVGFRLVTAALRACRIPHPKGSSEHLMCDARIWKGACDGD